MNTLSAVIPQAETYQPLIFDFYSKEERIRFNSLQLLSHNFLLRKPYPLRLGELQDFSSCLKKISKEPSLTPEDKKLYSFAANFFRFSSIKYDPSHPSPIEMGLLDKFIELVNQMVLFDEEKGQFIPLDLARYIALERLDYTDLSTVDCIQNILYADDRNLIPYLLDKKEKFFTDLGIDTSFIKEYLGSSHKLQDSLALRDFILDSDYYESKELRKILVYSPLLGPTFFSSFFDAFYPEIPDLIQDLDEKSKQTLYDNMSTLEEIDHLPFSIPFQRLRGMLE